MFTPGDIQRRIRTQPFVPLRIVTSSGQSFDLYHPDLIMIGRTALMIGTASAEDPATFDLVKRVALMHFTALENLPVPSIPENRDEGSGMRDQG